VIAETAPVHIRGALISTYQLFITLGIFLAACFNYATYEHQRTSTASWRIPIGIGFAWALILGLGILLFPESTRYVASDSLLIPCEPATKSSQIRLPQR
jgi:SP family sugar:H+ symporter-like MFS transporter